MQLGGYQEYAGAPVAQEFSVDMGIEFIPRPQSNLRIRIAKSTTALQIAGIGDRLGGSVRNMTSLYISGLSDESRRPERLVSAIMDVANSVLFDLAMVNHINVEAVDFPRLVVVTARRFDTGPAPRIP